MRDEDIIRMANQTADFFKPYPDEEAIAGIANHFKMFWDPRMRNDLVALLEKNDERLTPLVRSAVSKLQ